jgi:hypothetical protein
LKNRRGYIAVNCRFADMRCNVLIFAPPRLQGKGGLPTGIGCMAMEKNDGTSYIDELAVKYFYISCSE